MTPAVHERANGHALVPLRLPEHGPLSGWPQDDPGQPRTAPDKAGRRALVMSAFRRNWWRLVFASVGAVAAAVSYGHIVNLFLGWHQTSVDAHLMPIAIDGLIIIGAGAAKGGQKRLGWSAIGPGLAASLYANVMNGLPHGWGAAMGSGWATVALFLATNVMERWKAAPAVRPPVDKPADRMDDDRARSGQPGKNGGEGTGLAGSRLDKLAAVTAPHVDKQVDKPAPRRTALDKRTAMDKPVDKRTAMDKAAAAIRDNPHLDKAEDKAELARIAGVSAKTIQRARNGGRA